MMDGFGIHGWGMWLGWLIGIVFLTGFIWFIINLINQNKKGNQHDSKAPLDILKDRYARGEIDTDEFEERKNNLLDKKKENKK